MFVPTSPSTMSANQTEIYGNFSLVTWTKDSIYVRWDVADKQRPFVTGYKILFQAIGSTVRQYINLDNPDMTEYDITQLHENTNYNLCMSISTNLTSESSSWDCIKGTTATDSLSVALGSTFGAFLALGIIVLFVFLAKWQHNRKLKRQLQQVTPSNADSYDSMAQQDGEIEMSDVSLQVHDDTGKWDFSSQSSSQFSNFVNGATRPGGAVQTNHIGACSEGATAAAAAAAGPGEGGADLPHPSTSHTATANRLPRQNSTSSSNPQPSTSKALLQAQLSMDNQCDGLLKPPPPPGIVTTAPSKQTDAPPPDVRPKDVRPKDVRPKDVRPKDVRPKEARPRDVRPKDRPLLDLTNAYQNTPYGDPEAGTSGIRPNMSCNW